MKKLKYLVTICTVFMLMSLCRIQVEAAGSVTIFLDKTQLEVNEELRVTVQTSEPEDDAVLPEVVLNYDSSLLDFEYCSGEYGGGEGGLITFEGTTANLSFIAKKSGTASFNAEAVIDEDGNHKATAARSVAIKGDSETQNNETTQENEEVTEEKVSDDETQETTDKKLSSNANLKSFKATDVTIEPKFHKNITEYTVTLEENIPQFVFTAKTGSKKAKIIAASGFSNLKNGSNKAVLTVKAEDGTTKSYFFTIIKEGKAASTEDTESREVVEAVNGMVSVADSELAVNTTFPADILPDGCIKVDYIYKEQIVEAAFFEPGEIMLLYLTKQDGGEGAFYIYYSGTDEFMDFIQIKGSEGQFIFPVQFPVGVVIPDRFQDTSMQWGEKTVPAFMVSDGLLEEDMTETEADTTGDSETAHVDVEAETTQETEEDSLNPQVEPTDFYLIYAMNQDGRGGFYLYDTLEGTYQRYLEITSYEEQTGTFDGESYVIYKNKSQQRMVVIGVLIVIIVILLFVLLNMFLSLKELKEHGDDEEDDDSGEEERDESMQDEEDVQASVIMKEKKKGKKAPKKMPMKEAREEREAKRAVEKELAAEKVFEQIVQMEEASQNEGQNESRNEPHKQVRKPIMYDLTMPKIDENLTPKMQREQLDDDFEFEFINIDEE